MKKRLADIANLLSSALLLVLMAVMFADAVLRNFWNSPIAGGGEIVGIAQVGLVFVALAVVAANNDHIAVDIFDSFVGPKVRWIQHIFSTTLGIGFFGLLGFQSFKLGQRSLSYNEYTGAIDFPVGYLFWFISGMSVLTALILVISLFETPRSRDNSITDEV
ncbi:TRAP transporter small permease [Hoeflea alexandrii]|uniref:TRAP transporter small permease n=1 Tax=Hoeflea alexandrii TaxID=288436 RepID=UPI0022B04408|nr:TRAP transporter small permease [Hoeflea alexandrii]MCZ4291560.1 TRAP transporter small permease [Hoeflea alexandrii]